MRHRLLVRLLASADCAAAVVQKMAFRLVMPTDSRFSSGSP